MQTDVTRQSFSSVILQFIVFAVVFSTGYIYSHPGIFSVQTIAAGFYLPGEYLNSFAGRFPVATIALSVFILFVNAFVITKTVSRNLVYPTRTYLPCVFYLIVAAGICYPAFDLAAVLASWLMVRATVSFISSFVRTVSFSTTFTGAFLVGLTPLLEPQNMIYLLLVPIATTVFRRCPRETAVAIFGSLLPSLFAGYVYWAAGGEFTGIFKEVWSGFITPAVAAPGHLIAGLPLGGGTEEILRLSVGAILALTLIFSVFSFLSSSSDMRTRAYKIQVFALWFLILAAASMALPSRCPGNFTVLAIPAAIIAPAFFVRHRGVVPLSLYVLICLVTLAAGVFSFV